MQISLRDGYQSTKKGTEVSKTPKRANVLAKQVKRPLAQPAAVTSQQEVTSQSVGVVNSQQYGHVVQPATNQQLASVSPQQVPAAQIPPVSGVVGYIMSHDDDLSIFSYTSITHAHIRTHSHTQTHKKIFLQ